MEFKTIVRVGAGKNAQNLRKQGLIPIILYGKGIENRLLQAEKNHFLKVFGHVGQSQLLDVKIGDQSFGKAIIQDLQVDPVTNQIIHIDLHRVRMDEKIHAEIPIIANGVSPAVKEFGGTMIKSIEFLKVECFPADLISEIVVDATTLKTFEDQICVKDLSLPSVLHVLNAPNEVVITVVPPQKEEEETPKEPTEAETPPAETGEPSETKPADSKS